MSAYFHTVCSWEPELPNSAPLRPTWDMILNARASPPGPCLVQPSASPLCRVDTHPLTGRHHHHCERASRCTSRLRHTQGQRTKPRHIPGPRIPDKPQVPPQFLQLTRNSAPSLAPCCTASKSFFLLPSGEGGAGCRRRERCPQRSSQTFPS